MYDYLFYAPPVCLLAPKIITPPKIEIPLPHGSYLSNDKYNLLNSTMNPKFHRRLILNAQKTNLFPPDDNFLKRLATRMGKTYTKGKDGLERFYTDDHIPIYPPNDGAIGEQHLVKLTSGQRFSRYGSPKGSFLGALEDPFEARSLPPSSRDEYHILEVLKDVTASKGIIAPWFGQPGHGTQYKISRDILNDFWLYFREVQL